MDKRIIFVLTAALALNFIVAVTPAMAQGAIVLVPDVVGMTKAEAEAALNPRSLVPLYTYEYSETVPGGHVISQDPVGGTRVVRGSTVALAISSTIEPPLPVYFADPDLKAAVEAELRVTNPTSYSMLALTQLDARNSNIDDLTGLECATNLEELHLYDNQISDISPLAGLTNLAVLGLYRNQISDISPLDGLTNLVALGLDGNQISDISPLAGLTNLESLGLNMNQISDISPLDGLTNLVALGLERNQISDISPLVGLTNLMSLYIMLNPLSPDAYDIYIPQMEANGVTVNHGSTRTIPYVVGMSESDADSEITSVELGVSHSYVNNDTVPAGDVISQEPSSGKTVGVGFVVQLTVSLGPLGPEPVVVPNVVGMIQAAASSAITSAGLVVGTISQAYSDSVAEGRVISQSPTGGASVPEGSMVNLIVSLGPPPPDPVVVPNVVGMTESDADSTITSDGLGVSHYYEYSDTVAEGHVISQNPTAGALVPEGSTVNLIVSLGPPSPDPVVVPDVVGMGEYYANSEITSAGLKVSHSYEYSDTVPEGEVISQYPSAGTSVEEGSYVDLTVSLGTQSGGGPSVPVTPEAASLLAHWKLDEETGVRAYDSAGENHAFVVGNPTWQPTGGMVGGALECDGFDDYVVNENVAELLNGLDGLTVALWIKSDLTGTDRGFIHFEEPSEHDNRGMRYDAFGADGGGMNVIKVGITTDAAGGTEPGRQQLESSGNLQTTDWQHLAMTWSSGEQLKLYVNGVLDTPTFNDPALTGVLTGYTKAIIGLDGKYNSSPDVTGWDGLIDDVRIYDRALSGNQIQMIMNPPIPGLVGHWKLDETYGTIAYDSVSDNDGILYGNPIWQPNGGMLGGALEFDGIDDYVEVPHDETLTVDTEVAVMAWINTERHYSAAGNWQAILSKSNEPRSYSLYTFVEGNLHFSVGPAGAYVGSNSTGEVPLNEWVHVCAMVIEGQHQYYINGEDAGTGGTGTVLPGTADSATVRIGLTHEGGNNFLGMIDDVRIYDRALSADEIEAIMKNSGEDLLVNGGFEDGVVSPWTVYDGVTTEIVGALQNAAVPETPIEGGSCLHVVVPTVSTNYRERSLQYEGLLFEKGKKYTLSAFLKCSQGMLPMSISLELGQSPWTEYAAQFVATTDQWAEYSITTDVMTEDVSPGQIVFYIGYMPGEFWIDGVRFYEGDYILPGN